MPGSIGTKDHYGRNPFYFAADCLTATLGRDIEKFGLPGEQIDWWFDNQQWEENPFIAEYEAGRNLALPNPPLFKVLHNLPNFADERQGLPLQAADLLAWWERQRYIERLMERPELPYPWKARRAIPGVRIEYNERQILEHQNKEIEYLRKRGLLPPNYGLDR